MNIPINPTKTPQTNGKHPYEALMKGIPGVVSMYLLDLNQKDFPYVEVYAEDLRRLNIQPDRLKGKPYNWHGICPGIRTLRVQAIDMFISSKFDTASYEYHYWDKGALWEFIARLIRLPYNYLLLTVTDANDWQKHYWESSARPLESLIDDDDDDNDDDDIPSE